MKDYYAVLDIASIATIAEIKSAYRKKASQLHPDKNTSKDAPAKFREVQEAYETLSVLEKRQIYDENRRRSLLDDPIETAREIWQNYIDGMINK